MKHSNSRFDLEFFWTRRKLNGSHNFLYYSKRLKNLIRCYQVSKFFFIKTTHSGNHFKKNFRIISSCNFPFYRNFYTPTDNNIEMSLHNFHIIFCRFHPFALIRLFSRFSFVFGRFHLERGGDQLNEQQAPLLFSCLCIHPSVSATLGLHL